MAVIVRIENIVVAPKLIDPVFLDTPLISAPNTSPTRHADGQSCSTPAS